MPLGISIFLETEKTRIRICFNGATEIPHRFFTTYDGENVSFTTTFTAVL